jgi:hypothetical protein
MITHFRKNCNSEVSSVISVIMQTPIWIASVKDFLVLSVAVISVIIVSRFGSRGRDYVPRMQFFMSVLCSDDHLVVVVRRQRNMDLSRTPIERDVTRLTTSVSPSIDMRRRLALLPRGLIPLHFAYHPSDGTNLCCAPARDGGIGLCCLTVRDAKLYYSAASVIQLCILQRSASRLY